MTASRPIWISWETHRRNRSLVEALEIDLVEYDIDANRAFRWLICSIKTVSLLVRQRPRVVIVQNPSLILAVLATVAGKLSRLRVVVDQHNSGIFPAEGRSQFLRHIADFVIRNAEVNIVTNASLLAHVEARGGNGFVLQDPIPRLGRPASQTPLAGQFNLLFICTWADDEPFMAVIEAARQLDPSVVIYISGNWRKCDQIDAQSMPPNVILTGFLAEADFDALLWSVDAVMDLTTREDCLVCGAYEALAVERPLILSDTRALQAYFGDAAIYTENTVDGIASAVVALRQDIDQAQRRTRERAAEIKSSWEASRNSFAGRLRELLNV